MVLHFQFSWQDGCVDRLQEMRILQGIRYDVRRCCKCCVNKQSQEGEFCSWSTVLQCFVNHFLPHLLFCQYMHEHTNVLCTQTTPLFHSWWQYHAKKLKNVLNQRAGKKTTQARNDLHVTKALLLNIILYFTLWDAVNWDLDVWQPLTDESPHIATLCIS